jgi:hypothetical protein
LNKKNTGVQEFRSSGVQEFRSSGVQEFRSSGVQEFRSSGVQENSGERCGCFGATLDELNLGGIFMRFSLCLFMAIFTLNDPLALNPSNI